MGLPIVGLEQPVSIYQQSKRKRVMLLNKRISSYVLCVCLLLMDFSEYERCPLLETSPHVCV